MAVLLTPCDPRPNRAADDHCTVSFCGMHFRFRGLDSGLIKMVQSRYGADDCGAEAAQAVEVEVEFRRLKSKPDELFTGPNGYEPLVEPSRTGVRLEGPGFTADILLAPRVRARLVCSDRAEFPKATVYENVLRVIASYAVASRGGLFMHSAAVLVDGSAYLFLGRSNAGKSTISKMALSAGHAVLSDDANIIYPGANGRYVADAVPFAGELGQTGPGSDGPFDVAAIFWLEKGSGIAVNPLCMAECVSRLMVCSPVLNVDPFRMELLMGRLEDITRQVPVAHLRFSRDVSFHDILQHVENFMETRS